MHRKGSKTYGQLTRALKAWAENTLQSLAVRTPKDLVLPLVMNKTTGEPEQPQGALRNQVAVLGSYHSYHGLVSPSWANGYPSSKKIWSEIPLDAELDLGCKQR